MDRRPSGSFHAETMLTMTSSKASPIYALPKDCKIWSAVGRTLEYQAAIEAAIAG